MEVIPGTTTVSPTFNYPIRQVNRFTVNLVERMAQRSKELTNMSIAELRYLANTNKSDVLNKGELVEMVLLNEFI